MKRYAMVLSCLSAVSCAKKEDAESKPLELSKTEYATYSVASESTKEQVEANFGSHGDAYQSPSFAATALLEDTPSCADDFMNSAMVKATKTQITLDVSGDLTACMQEMGSPASEFKTAMKLNIQCDDSVDLSSYDGKKLNEIPDSDNPCTGSKSYSQQMLVAMDLAMADESGSMKMHMDVASRCAYTLDGTTVTTGEDCFAALRTTGAATVEGQSIDLSDGAFDDLGGLTFEDVPTARWFSSGTATIKFSEWEGTVTFNGANTAPTWELKKGSETVSGTFTTAFKLTTAERFQKAITAKFFPKK